MKRQIIVPDKFFVVAAENLWKRGQITTEQMNLIRVRFDKQREMSLNNYRTYALFDYLEVDYVW